MESIQKSLDPRIVGEIIAKRKWYLILPFVVTVAVGAFLIEDMTEIFRVQSRVLYEDRSPLARDIEQRLLPGSQETGRKRQEDKMDEAIILREKVLSEDFLVEIADELGIMGRKSTLESAARRKEETGDPSSVEQIARQNVSAWLKSMISITLSSSNIYQITTEGENPTLIFELAKLINGKLQSAIQSDELDRINAASNFTESQIVIYQEKTDNARRDLRIFLGNIAEQRRREALSAPSVNRGDASRLAEETGFEIDRLRERIASNRSVLARSYAIDLDQFTADLPAAIVQYRGRLVAMEEQLGYLLLERTWSDPTVITQNGRIGEARREIEQLVEERGESVFADRSAFVRQIVAEGARDLILLATLETRRATFVDQAIDPPGPDAGTKRRREERRETLDASTSITVAVEKDDDIRSIRVIRSPRWPNQPIYPNKIQLYAIAVLAGLAFGGVFMILREYLDNSIRDVHEAEELMGVPIIGTIPKIDFAGMPGEHAGLRKGVLFAVLGMIVASAVVGYYIYYGDGGDGAIEEEKVETSVIDQDRRTSTDGA